MKYGCIGEHLKHSFSKEIHNALADYEYEIKEIPRSELDGFMKNGDFNAINVTIPYKELVIPYLYFVDERAKEIGAVNTVVNRNGRLYGYNTDFYGMTMLLSHANIDVRNKKVVILGTGGTSKTAKAVAKALSAREIITVSRSGKDGAVTYDELHSRHSDAEVIINTTPAGMYPNIFEKTVELSGFKSLCGVIDAVYNPLKTPLVLEAESRGIAAEGGLYMLVAQALRASEIFTNTSFDTAALDCVYEKIKRDKQNIVLIGMPASGKSTVGRLVAEKLRRDFVDTDEMIAEKAGMSIPNIFAACGEKKFREMESEIIRDVSVSSGIVIATGGGVPLKTQNMSALCENGRIYFIDRSLERLIPTEDRPLSSTKEAIEQRYKERYSVYTAAADVIIDADCDAVSVADKITEEFLK